METKLSSSGTEAEKQFEHLEQRLCQAVEKVMITEVRQALQEHQSQLAAAFRQQDRVLASSLRLEQQMQDIMNSVGNIQAGPNIGALEVLTQSAPLAAAVARSATQSCQVMGQQDTAPGLAGPKGGNGSASSFAVAKQPTKKLSRKDASGRRALDSPLAHIVQIWKEDAQAATNTPSYKLRLIEFLEWWINVQEPERSGCFNSILESRYFDMVSTVVIILNALYLGHLANFAMATPYEEPSLPMRVVEVCFTVFFIVELTLKFIVHRLYFFANATVRMNLLDLLLVVMSVYDFISWVSLMGNVTFLRSLRMLKLAKMLRMIRVLHIFQDLRMMVYSIIGSVVSLLWCFVMLGFILYMFSLVFLQAFSDLLSSEEQGVDEDVRQDINEKFGTVTKAMLTMFKLTTGEGWGDIYDLIQLAGFVYKAIFVFFVGFIQFAVTNILTALFLENAIKNAQPDRNAMIFEQRRQELAEATSMKNFCGMMDHDDSGSISLDKLQMCLKDDRARAYLALQGLHVQDIELFFKLLADGSGSTEVDIELFAEGCMKMKGSANAMDMQTLLFHTKAMQRQNDRFTKAVNQKLNAVMERILVLECTGQARCPSMAEAAAQTHDQNTTSTEKHLMQNGFAFKMRL
eukprot:gnl/TRDRNA2_/TRDRNA2_202674_c0_seq1.p1 gnl/TRDRNA2_/TRDRNA2_202674_c0~~gnl/TRDRNA2_/TRDRNA2_202674_c0_seq1.p1  ORF type:complete len:631 (+),score=115.14 gnl/TRDRNA2_/TRDRNA2_202674_c0_seq1:58-1950(+)